jgi:uncharacterized protein YkwD
MRVAFRVKQIALGAITAKAAGARRASIVAMTEAARMDTLPYVPFVSGALARTADTESKPERGLLIYGNAAVPYARAQYYGMPNKTRKAHAHATLQWFEAAKAAKKRTWQRIAASEYDRHFGG